MPNTDRLRPEFSPSLQILLLIAYALGGVVICTLIGMAIILPIYGMDVLSNLSNPTWTNEQLGALKILQLSNSIGLFLVPPIAATLTERKELKSFYGFKTPKFQLLIAVFVLACVSMPIMEWLVTVNQKLKLPTFLASLEQWMKQKEEESAKIITLFLKANDLRDYAYNLFLVALVPGIAEEFLFRGGLQRAFSRMFKNPHVAIWIAAFIFSAIHLQFYGFLPRMVLGALFGYIYYWTSNLWYAMFAHFLNNAYAVTVAYYFQKHNIPLEESDKTINLPIYGYFLSILLSGLIILYFKKESQKNGERMG